MADSVEIASVLPKELRLGVPPKMPQGRSYLFRQQSTLQTYNPTQTITINIPRLQRSYLRKDSYLRFRINGMWTPNNARDVLALDTCGAYGFFDRIEVFDYLGSTVLETISGVPQLSALLLDLGLKEIMDNKNGGALAGLGYDYAATGIGSFTGGQTAGAPIKGSAILTNNGPTFPSSGGATIASSGGGTTAVPFCREFAIPLPSFLGLLSEKYVPLHNGFSIVLTLSTSATPFFVSQTIDPSIAISSSNTVSGDSGTASATFSYPSANLTWSIGDVYMNCQILELGPVADAMMMTSTQGQPMVVHTKSMRNYVGTVKGATQTTTGTPGTPSPGTAPTSLTITSGSNDKFVLTLANGNSYTITIAAAAPYASLAALGTAVQNAINTAVGSGQFTVTTSTGVIISSTSPFSLSASSANTGLANLNITAGTFGFTTTSIVTGQQEFVLNMNLNVSSLTDILFIMRSSAQLDNLTFLSCGHRTRNFLQRWQFQYGSTALPQSNGIQTMASYIPSQVNSTTNLTTTPTQAYELYSSGGLEGYQELMKARPFFIPANRMIEQCFSWDARFNYNLDNRALASRVNSLNLNGILPTLNSYTNIGRFAGGLNLQLANNKDGQMVTGLNTNGMNTSIRGIFHPLYTDLMDTVRVDAWAEYDAFINISPGIATTVSF
jgi:hypothetical protein